MTTSTLELIPPEQVRRVPPVSPTGSGSYLGWAVAWLGSIALGAIFSLSFLTGLVVLGWLGRWMRGRVLRGLYRVSPLAEQFNLGEACELLGERMPGRPHWFLREGPAENPERGSFVNALLWPIGSLGVNLRLGVKLALGTWLTLGWACALFFFAWEYGWEVSFNKQYERSFVGIGTTLFGMSLFALILPYVLLAQVHVAVTGELKSMLDHRLIRKMVRVSLWSLLLVAGLLLLAGAVFEGLKAVGRLAAGQHLGSEPTSAEILALQQHLQVFFFWSCVGLLLTLLILKGLAAWIYRRALVRLLQTGEIRAGDLPPILARWVNTLQLRSSEHSSRVSRLWRALRVLGRGGLRMVLFLVLFLFAFRTHVGVFLTYDPGLSSSFVNQPLVQVPWFNFTPGNLEDLAKAAEPAQDERP